MAGERMPVDQGKSAVPRPLVVLAILASGAAVVSLYVFFGGGVMAEQTMEMATDSSRCDDLRQTTLSTRVLAAVLSFLCGAQGLALLKDDLSKTTRFWLAVITVVIGSANAGVTALSTELATDVERQCGQERPPESADG